MNRASEGGPRSSAINFNSCDPVTHTNYSFFMICHDFEVNGPHVKVDMTI